MGAVGRAGTLMSGTKSGEPVQRREPDHVTELGYPGASSLPDRVYASGTRFTRVWNWNARTRGTVFWVLIALSVLLLWTVRSVLAPFVIGAILSYLIHPLVRLTSRYTRLPRAGSVAVVYLAVAGLITWGVIVLVPVVSKEARELSLTLPRIVARARDIIDQDPHLSVLGYDVSIAPLVDEVTRSVGTVVSAVSRGLLDTAVATVETFFKGMLTLVITFYLLMGAERFKWWVGHHTPQPYRDELSPIVKDIDRILGRFLRGEVVLIVIMTIATWATLSALGIRYALILGLIAGILELIPFVGTWMAAIPAVVVAMATPSPHGWSPLVSAGIVGLAYFILRHAEDYFVIPFVMGRAVHIHALVAMFSVLSGAVLGGVLGMFLGVPTAAALRIIIGYIYGKLTEPMTVPNGEEALLQASLPASDLETTG